MYRTFAHCIFVNGLRVVIRLIWHTDATDHQDMEPTTRGHYYMLYMCVAVDLGTNHGAKLAC